MIQGPLLYRGFNPCTGKEVLYEKEDGTRWTLLNVYWRRGIRQEETETFSQVELLKPVPSGFPIYTELQGPIPFQLLVISRFWPDPCIDS